MSDAVPAEDASAEVTSAATVVFCGERYDVPVGGALTIGRDADLVVDDNPFLHRQLLTVEHRAGLWWLVNTGARLSATVGDRDGLIQSWLGPGAALPLVLPHTIVLFTAGPTTYEVEVLVPGSYTPTGVAQDAAGGASTLAPPVLTATQYLLVLALAEPLLRHGIPGRAEIPSSAEAARRLGWSLTRFNRKLDNVCQKLARIGVRGVHGGPGALASGRRARLVEYAVSSRLVTPEQLYLLDEPQSEDAGDS
jgi:hypothetical protein